eukprot:TRINITY_DN212_c0_g1_i1.p2 TRINITY_DN212_c0_g1~~TRINITY_DN212_c0_g1_i1.p2  ORF type:complete len:349 (+),score=61.23 TRINITY_DN212_c0_g1_i1:1931-2977(+)
MISSRDMDNFLSVEPILKVASAVAILAKNNSEPFQIEFVSNTAPLDKKLSMSLDEIIKTQQPAKKKRPVGKDATMRNQLSAKQRKAKLTENSKQQSSEKRAKQVAARRGVQQENTGRKAKPRVNRAFGNGSWNKQQQLREQNARKKASTFGKKGLLGASLGRATAAPASSATGRALRRVAAGGNRRSAATAAGGRPVSFKVKLSNTGVQQRVTGVRGRQSNSPRRQQQQTRGAQRVSVKQQTIANRLSGGNGRAAAARQAGKSKAQRIVDQRRGISQQQQQQPRQRKVSARFRCSAALVSAGCALAARRFSFRWPCLQSRRIVRCLAARCVSWQQPWGGCMVQASVLR